MLAARCPDLHWPVARRAAPTQRLPPASVPPAIDRPRPPQRPPAAVGDVDCPSNCVESDVASPPNKSYARRPQHLAKRRPVFARRGRQSLVAGGRAGGRSIRRVTPAAACIRACPQSAEFHAVGERREMVSTSLFSGNVYAASLAGEDVF